MNQDPPSSSVPGLLDPETPAAFRALAHETLDEVLDELEEVRSAPVWHGVSDEVCACFEGPLSEEGIEPRTLVRRFTERVRPHVLRTTHPRWWGYVAGSGTPVGALAGFLTDALNLVALGGDQASTLVEEQVLSWAKEMVGFPESASGVLMNGASAATHAALAVAIRTHGGERVVAEGVAGAPGLVLYGSDQTHSCVRRAVDLLGLGREALRTVATDEVLRIDVGNLAAAVARDRTEGRQPFCVVASAGTVDTGAIDPLEELAGFCADEGLWLHVDGAIGAPLGLSPRFARLRTALSRADSIAFDYHKWLCVPFSVGAVLMRDADAHRRCFEIPASYTTQLERGLSSKRTVWRDLSPDLSRPFWALKVWMTLQATGRRRYVELFDRNIEQARYLGSLVEAAADLELLAPVSLNIVCFGYRPGSGFGGDRDALNREILMDLQESGRAVLTHTFVKGRLALRACLTNHRTRAEDLEAVVAAVQELGAARASGTG